MAKTDVQTSNEKVTDGIKVKKAITILHSPETIYKFWRDFKNLPTFMKNVKEVVVLNSKQSTWKVEGPAGKTVEWQAEIIEDQPGKRISWQTIGNSDVPQAGSVTFTDKGPGIGTEVHVQISYHPPGGVMGEMFAKVFGVDPNTTIQEDLRRLKQWLEVGEIATVEGQTSGREKDQEKTSEEFRSKWQSPNAAAQH